MAETMRTIEAIPESWPVIPETALIQVQDSNGQPVAIGDQSWVWQRIESYCAHRWTPREVTWLVQGDGIWTPPLWPATITKVEHWSSDWAARVVDISPWGGIVLRGDAHRITAIVGADNPAPPAVIKAAARLTNYLMQQIDPQDPDLWATSMRWIVTPEMKDGETAPGHKTQESYTRPADYIAKALQYSGAADLLRPYRRAK